MTTIPEGYSSLTPYVTIDDVAAAIALYEKAFDAKVMVSMPSPDGGVMHAELQIGNARLMMGAPCEDYKGKSAKTLGASPVSFYLYVEDADGAFAKAKNVGMTPKTELADMFWGDRIGTLTDEFGMDWTVAQHVRDVTPEEIAEALKQMTK